MKVVSGGPMMGFAQADLAPSCGKGTSSLLFLTDEEISDGDKPISACINCASCASHCPMHLMPMFIERAVDAEDAAEAKKLHALTFRTATNATLPVKPRPTTSLPKSSRPRATTSPAKTQT